MAQEARDSGICVDNDTDSVESSAASSNQLSYVQRLRLRFECLAKEQEREFHAECNWWLNEDGTGIQEQSEEEEEEEEEEHIEKVDDVKPISRHVSVEYETRNYSKQSSLRSQVSRDSSRGETLLIITPATPVKSPNAPKEFPVLKLTDYQENNETNDSDSFDSDEGDDDVIAEDGEDLEEEEEVFVEQSGNVLRLNRPVSTSSQTSIVSSKLHNIVRELLENEENYVRSLKAGIENYMSVFSRKELPKTLRGQKHRIFANIKSIYSFHCYEFLPALVNCFDDPEQIADVFTNFVTRDFFYGYIIYAINRKRSELLCNYDSAFWKKIQAECGDRLGINSFLLQPIQRLPRYQMLLGEIIKDLSKDIENTKLSIAACCVAEKNMQRLIVQVNESMSINDIRNCYEIDVLSQGKFKKMDEFDIYDWDARRRMRGKVFLFERGVIYTEALDREYLEFRGHFGSDKLGIIYKEGKSKFRLFAKKRGNKEVEFRANMTTVLEWHEIIKAMLMKFVEEEKVRNASSKKRKNSLISIRPTPDTARNSMISTRSDQSFQSMSSYRSSSGNSSLGRESVDTRRSQWYV